jgi:hypothetical protein
MSPAPSRPAGPVDIAVIGFSGELRQGGIRQAIADAVGTGAVRVLDVVLVRKEDDGTVIILDAEKAEGSEELLGFPTELPDLVGVEDVMAIAEEIVPGTTVLVIAWENVWAAHISAAIRELDGQVIALERIPAADVAAVVDALSAQEYRS